MPDSVSDQYLHPYREAVRQHGPGFAATLWGSREAQLLRFDVMTDLVGGRASLEECVLLDVGCGRGDFAAHLLEHGASFVRYVGLDAIDALVTEALARKLARCEFEVVDVVERPDALAHVRAEGRAPDWAFVSGTLNTMDEPCARSVIDAAFRASAQGVVFNFLSSCCHPRWAAQDISPARRFDTLGWLDWAMGLSSRVSFTQDYLDGHDATVMIRHE